MSKFEELTRFIDVIKKNEIKVLINVCLFGLDFVEM